MPLEFGIEMRFHRIADAQIGDECPSRRNIEGALDVGGIENRDPADPKTPGPRRQPELSEVAEYSPEPQPADNDLALLDDDDLPLPLPRQLDPAMQRTARLASLDQQDGIEL